MALLSTVSRSNWNLEMLVFVEGGKPEYPEKNPRSRDENQQQTQPTYDTETGNRTQATLVGGECSHHCAIPAPHDYYHDVSKVVLTFKFVDVTIAVFTSEHCFMHLRARMESSGQSAGTAFTVLYTRWFLLLGLWMKC